MAWQSSKHTISYDPHKHHGLRTVSSRFFLHPSGYVCSHPPAPNFITFSDPATDHIAQNVNMKLNTIPPNIRLAHVPTQRPAQPTCTPAKHPPKGPWQDSRCFPFYRVRLRRAVSSELCITHISASNSIKGSLGKKTPRCDVEVPGSKRSALMYESDSAIAPLALHRELARVSGQRSQD
jgi:hypothetical protein